MSRIPSKSLLMEIARKGSSRPSTQTTPSSSRRTSLDSSFSSPHSVTSAGKDGSDSAREGTDEVLQAAKLLETLDLAVEPTPQPLPPSAVLSPPIAALRAVSGQFPSPGGSPRPDLTVNTTHVHSPSPSHTSLSTTPAAIALTMLSRDPGREAGTAVKQAALHRLSRTTSAAKAKAGVRSQPVSPPIRPEGGLGGGGGGGTEASDAETQFLVDLRRYREELQSRVDATSVALPAPEPAELERAARAAQEAAENPDKESMDLNKGASDANPNYCFWPVRKRPESPLFCIQPLFSPIRTYPFFSVLRSPPRLFLHRPPSRTARPRPASSR